MKTLNLRHVQNLTAQDLIQYSSSCTNADSAKAHLHSLWMGPHFGGGGRTLEDGNNHTGLFHLLQSIPSELIQLDLDLTLLSMQQRLQQQQQEAEQDMVVNDGNVDTDNEESFQTTDLTLFGDIMSALMERLTTLQSLSLRCDGPYAVFGLAKAISGMKLSIDSTMTRDKNKPSLLHVLDFRGNHMGDEGARALVKAILPVALASGKTTKPTNDSWSLPHLRHLILSWNDLTDDGVATLLPLLTKNKSGSGLKCLDLSCNPDLTNVSLNQHFVRALSAKKQSSLSSLEQLVLFSCRQINYLSPELVQTVCHDNFSLQQLNLQGTGCNLFSNDWEQMQFALQLNAAGRQVVLGKDRLQEAKCDDRKTRDSEDQSSTDKDEHAMFCSNLWWTNGGHSKKRKVTPCSNELLNVFLHHNHHQDLTPTDLSVMYYFCRETVHQWCLE